MKKVVMTLCVLHNNERILLGMKKRGFGEGRWNGFGGKVNEGERIEEAALRELREEAGIEARTLRKRGVFDFSFEGKPEMLEVHVFSSDDFINEPRESDEMRPQWFNFSDVPFDSMWPDDRHWLPHVLAGRNVSGEFHFLDKDTIISHDMRVS